MRLDTDLWFIYRVAREGDPVIRAMLEVLAGTWKLAGDPRARATS